MFVAVVVVAVFLCFGASVVSQFFVAAEVKKIYDGQ